MSTVTPSRPVPARPAARSRPAPTTGRGASIDPFRVLRRHIVLLIASGILGVGIGVAAHVGLAVVSPYYSSQVLFEIQPGLVEAGSVGTQELLRDEEVYRMAKTELVLMMDREVLTNAVGDPDVQTKTEWFRNNFVDDNQNPLVAEAVDELEEDLQTSVLRGTELFQLGWSAHVAADLPIVLNAVASAYMEKREALDNQVFNQNLELFNRQLSQTHLEIQDLDQEIQAFIIDADITSLEDPRYHENSIMLLNLIAQIAGASQELSMTQSAYMRIAAKLEGTMEPSAADVLEAEMDFAVASHIRIAEQLKLELRVTREKFLHDNVRVQRAEATLRAAMEEKKIKTDEIIRRNLNAKLKMNAGQMESLQRMIEQLETEAEARGEQLSELAAQQSSFEALRSQREHLEETRGADRQLIKEIQLMRLRTDAERVAIAVRSQTPRELAFPKLEIIVPLCTLLVVGFIVGIIFLREMTDQRVKSASDLSVVPGAHVLGVIPDLHEDPTTCEAAELVLRRFPHSVVAESYRQVCTPFSKLIDQNGHQTIVVMGGLPGAGTTTVTSNLAIGWAATGRSVLVVDTNFRRPRLAEVFDLDRDRMGLGDVLASTAEFEQAVVEIEPGVHVLTAGSPGSRVVERLNSEAFEQLIAQVRSRFDAVFFDAPPAVVAGDAIVVANKVDAAVLVVRANQEQRGLIARVMNQIAAAQCDLLGIVLNRPLVTAGGYFKKNFAVMAEYATGQTS